jgi:outer membrane protein OmpA-like peptidoglycan-associated protein
MKKIIFACLLSLPFALLLSAQNLSAQKNISGKWFGPISYEKDGVVLFRGRVTFDFVQKADQISGKCFLETDQNGSVEYPLSGTFRDNKIEFVEKEGDKKPASGILGMKTFSGTFHEKRVSKVNEKKFSGEREIKGVFTFSDKNLPEISVFTFAPDAESHSEASINPKEIFRINNLRFDKNRFDILPNDELEKLLIFLKNNPSYLVHIEGHTDEDGGEDYNLALSLKRANSVKKFLLQNGIASENITTAGIGSKKPISDEKEANRRVEVSFSKRK